MAKQFNANKFLDELVTAGNLPKEVAESIKTSIVGNENAVKYLQTSFATKQWSDSQIAEAQNKSQQAIAEANRLKGEYETKIAAVTGLEGQIKQKEQQLQGEWGQKAQATQQQLAILEQQRNKAVQDVQRVIQIAQGYQGGDTFLTAAGLPINPQGYVPQPIQQPYGQPPVYSQQPYTYDPNNPYAQQPSQGFNPYGQPMYNGNYQPVATTVPQQGQPVYANGGYQSQQQQPKQEAPSLDDLYKQRFIPDMMNVANLALEVPEFAYEYQQLTGQRFNTTEFREHLRQTQGAKTAREVFDETYNIPYLREQKAKADREAEINARVEEMVKERMAAIEFPSAKSVHVDNPFADPSKPPQQQQPTEQLTSAGARSTLGDALRDYEEHHKEASV